MTSPIFRPPHIFDKNRALNLSGYRDITAFCHNSAADAHTHNTALIPFDLIEQLNKFKNHSQRRRYTELKGEPGRVGPVPKQHIPKVP
jgi:hypothetical protein